MVVIFILPLQLITTGLAGCYSVERKKFPAIYSLMFFERVGLASENLPPQYDTGGSSVSSGVNMGSASVFQPSSILRTGLVDQKINTIDPSFYDCIYNSTTGQIVIERCYKDLGCCATTCCSNDDWKTKYGWAVALIVVFCIIVVIAVVLSLIVWLINRAKDKRQKRLLDDSGLSRATSNMSLAQSTPGGYHYGTGPFKSPPVAGYRY